MRDTVFLPSSRQTAILSAFAIAALRCAFYLRYRVVEPAAIGIACDAAGNSLFCGMRRALVLTFVNSAFGWVGLGAALLNLLRPSVVLVAIALVACGFGLVLYNTLACALAVPLLVLSLARRAPEPE